MNIRIAGLVILLVSILLMSSTSTAAEFESLCGGNDSPGLFDLIAGIVLGENNRWMKLTGCNDAPTAVIDYSPGTPLESEPVSFDASSSSDSDGTITDYYWDFDMDGTVEETGQNPSNSFAPPGDYEVNLTITDDDGENSSAKKTISVLGEYPEAKFSVNNSTPAVGDVVEFNASDSSDPDGSISSYEWDFDGSGTYTGSGQTNTHTYGSEGWYDATLKVTDDDGQASTATQRIHVDNSSSGNEPPDASFTHNASGAESGDVISFDASSSSDSDGSISSYDWDYGNDGTVDATGVTSENSFSGGEHEILLNVTDDDGAWGTAVRTITLSGGNKVPNCDFSYSPTEPLVGESVSFDASSSSDPDGSISSYSWSFGGSGSTASNSFTYSGYHDVTLTATDNDGASCSITKTVSVYSNHQPVIASIISYSPSNPATGETVSFNGYADKDPDLSWERRDWDFGDGGTASGTEDPSHSYSSEGNYTVTFTVEDSSGAIVTPSTTVKVCDTTGYEQIYSGSTSDGGTIAIWVDTCEMSSASHKGTAGQGFDGSSISGVDSSDIIVNWDEDSHGGSSSNFDTGCTLGSSSADYKVNSSDGANYGSSTVADSYEGTCSVDNTAGGTATAVVGVEP